MGCFGKKHQDLVIDTLDNTLLTHAAKEIGLALQLQSDALGYHLWHTNYTLIYLNRKCQKYAYKRGWTLKNKEQRTNFKHVDTRCGAVIIIIFFSFSFRELFGWFGRLCLIHTFFYLTLPDLLGLDHGAVSIGQAWDLDKGHWINWKVRQSIWRSWGISWDALLFLCLFRDFPFLHCGLWIILCFLSPPNFLLLRAVRCQLSLLDLGIRRANWKQLSQWRQH